jgi:hypothetical protein
MMNVIHIEKIRTWFVLYVTGLCWGLHPQLFLAPNAQKAGKPPAAACPPEFRYDKVRIIFAVSPSLRQTYPYPMICFPQRFGGI